MLSCGDMVTVVTEVCIGYHGNASLFQKASVAWVSKVSRLSIWQCWVNKHGSCLPTQTLITRLLKARYFPSSDFFASHAGHNPMFGEAFEVLRMLFEMASSGVSVQALAFQFGIQTGFETIMSLHHL